MDRERIFVTHFVAELYEASDTVGVGVLIPEDLLQPVVTLYM